MSKKEQKHSDISFMTKKGTYILLKYLKNEYRAFKNGNEDMKKGSGVAEPLKQYLYENF